MNMNTKHGVKNIDEIFMVELIGNLEKMWLGCESC